MADLAEGNPMKVHISTTWDIETGEILRDESFEYAGLVALCVSSVKRQSAQAANVAGGQAGLYGTAAQGIAGQLVPKEEHSAASLLLSQNQGSFIGTDGTNYFSERGVGGGGGGGGFLPWTALAPGVVAPVVLSQFPNFHLPSGFSATQQSANIVTLDSSLSSASSDFAVWDKAAPATPYTVVLGFIFSTGENVNFATVGITLRESSTGKLVVFAFEYDSTSYNPAIEGRYQTNTSTFSSNFYARQDWHIPLTVVWLSVTDDGTNLTFKYLPDGVNSIQIAQVSRTAFLASGPNFVGFGMANFAANGRLRATLLHWSGA